MSTFKDKIYKVVQDRTLKVSKELYEIAINQLPAKNPTEHGLTTPVFSSSMVASWRVTIGVESNEYSVVNNFQGLPTASRTGNPFPSTFKFKKSTLENIYIVNNVPYAGKVQTEGTKYSDPNILNRITESVHWS